MHDDTCMAYARGKFSGLSVHCWLTPHHPGDHFDRDLNIWWHQAKQLAVTTKPRYTPPWRRRELVAA